jgi:hypothetical protein
MTVLNHYAIPYSEHCKQKCFPQNCFSLQALCEDLSMAALSADTKFRQGTNRTRACASATKRIEVPEGRRENSPPFQRWVGLSWAISPEGTAESSSRKSKPDARTITMPKTIAHTEPALKMSRQRHGVRAALCRFLKIHPHRPPTKNIGHPVAKEVGMGNPIEKRPDTQHPSIPKSIWPVKVVM